MQHPNERPENRVVYRIEERLWRELADRYVRGVLLDIGCGEKPLAPLFKGRVTEHVGVDHADTQHATGAVDIVADAYAIPLPDESADTVVLSQVLEHLERPADALAEAHRLLRNGGHVILTTPLFWHLHEEPRDFYRYTPHGLRYLLEEAGFAVVDVRAYSGVWTTVALEISYALKAWRGGRADRLILAFTRLLQWLGPRADRLNYQPGFSCAHAAIGVKAA